MNKTLMEEVKLVHTAMLKKSASWGWESEADELHSLIRLSFEFLDFLDHPDLSRDAEEIRYRCESVFSGVASFLSVSATYRAFFRMPQPKPGLSTIDPEVLTASFRQTCYEFRDEDEFERRCGLLLELFRLQMIFASISY